MGAFLESHGKPILHDFLVVVGRFDAQLIELQELLGVGGAVVARRQIRLELARSGDATQLGGESAAARCGHRDPPWGWSLVLMGSTPCRYRWRMGLPQQPVLARWCEERRSILLRPRDFLTASFFTRGRETRRVGSRSRAS